MEVLGVETPEVVNIADPELVDRMVSLVDRGEHIQTPILAQKILEYTDAHPDIVSEY